MSEFARLMTMKLIERDRLEKDGVPLGMLIAFDDAVRNLNVRVPVHLIAQIEVLGSILDLSKAELVTEMLNSSLEEAFELLKKEGWYDSFLQSVIDRLRDHYGVNVERKPEETGSPAIPKEETKDE